MLSRRIAASHASVKSQSGVSSHRLGIFLSLTLLCVACSPARGCAEASFDLADESRLPRWTEGLHGEPRSKFDLEMTYYISLFGQNRRSALFTLKTKDGRVVSQTHGVVHGDHPLTLETSPSNGPTPYPRFEIITVNGITDVIEHRKLGDVFYVNDSADVRKRLGVVEP
jgi:hypothetical protein